MSIKNGYTQINNTLLCALMELPKWQRLTFTCLRVESDYRTHETDFLSVKSIVEFTGLKRQSVDIALRTLENKGWITKVDRKGYTYQWELSIAKLTNDEVHAFLYNQLELELGPEPKPEPKSEVPPVERFNVEDVDGKSVKTLNLGPRTYRYNGAIAEFEMRSLWKGENAWETANGHAEHLSESDKIELQSYAYE